MKYEELVEQAIAEFREAPVDLMQIGAANEEVAYFNHVERYLYPNYKGY